MNRRHRSRGFSLVESIMVLFVMSLVAILASALVLDAGQHEKVVATQGDFLTAEGTALALIRQDLRGASAQSCTVSSPVQSVPIDIPLGASTATRGTQIQIKKPSWSATTNSVVWGPSVITYTFQVSSTAVGSTLGKQGSLVKALAAAGVRFCELTRSETSVNGGRPITILDEIEYVPPAATAPYVGLAPYFELQNAEPRTIASQPKVCVVFNLVQPVRELKAKTWTFNIWPVTAVSVLQP